MPRLIVDPVSCTGWLLHGGVIPDRVFKLDSQGCRRTLATTEFMVLYVRRCSRETDVAVGVSIRDPQLLVHAPVW